MPSLPQPTEISRVFVLRLGAFGDILRTLPAVRALRAGLPGAALEWIVDDRWASVLDGDDGLDAVHALPRQDWHRTLGEFRRSLRKRHADLLVDFHGNLRSGVVGWLTGTPARLGYSGHQSKEMNRLFTTHRIPSGARRISRVERNLELVRALNVTVQGTPAAHPSLPRRGRDEAEEIHTRLGGSPFGAINPGASAAQAGKRPPIAALAAAARALARHELVPLVVWGPGEEDQARRVVEAAGPVARLAPSTTLPVLAALLERARLFVGGDSGPLHLACAVGCPVVGIYGPTDPCVNSPWGVPFRAVHPAGRDYTGIKRIDRKAGFEGLDASLVERAVDELHADLEGHQPSR